jgi:hypothetical protein
MDAWEMFKSPDSRTNLAKAQEFVVLSPADRLSLEICQFLSANFASMQRKMSLLTSGFIRWEVSMKE